MARAPRPMFAPYAAGDSAGWYSGHPPEPTPLRVDLLGRKMRDVAPQLPDPLGRAAPAPEGERNGNYIGDAMSVQRGSGRGGLSV